MSNIEKVIASIFILVSHHYLQLISMSIYIASADRCFHLSGKEIKTTTTKLLICFNIYQLPRSSRQKMNRTQICMYFEQNNIKIKIY